MKNSIINKLSLCLSCVIAVIAVVSTGIRISHTADTESLKLIAAGFSMPQGAVTSMEAMPVDDGSKAVAAETLEKTPATTDQQQPTQPVTEKATVDNSGKKTFPIIESTFGGSGLFYDNFYVRNTTDFNMDIEGELNSPMGFQMEDTLEPQVLIVHTHTTEGYMQEDSGFYYEGQEFRSSDDNYNITQVGAKIVETLNKNGVGAVQAKEHHDDPTYNGSYDRSQQTIYKYMEKYPSIKVIIDIHRDSVGYNDERGKLKPTFVVDGKKAAQIMIMSGYDPNNSYGFPNWEYNLRFALRLQQKAETMYPGMTRPLDFGDFAYNMFINTGSLLVEVGTDVNTMDEAEYSGELLANALSAVLT